MDWGHFVIVLLNAVLPLVLVSAVLVGHRRLDGSGLRGGLPFAPSNSGGFADTAPPAWVSDAARLDDDEAAGTAGAAAGAQR